MLDTRFLNCYLRGMFKGRNTINDSFFKSHSTVDTVTSCWNWTAFLQSSGYGQFRHSNKPVLAHRASWSFYNQSAIPEGLFICHKCNNPRCVNPAHLFLGTALDNTRDVIAKGRARTFCKGHVHGRKKRRRKLSDDQVREIRVTLYNLEPLRVIAARYGVTMACISTIRRGKRKKLVI